MKNSKFLAAAAFLTAAAVIAGQLAGCASAKTDAAAPQPAQKQPATAAEFVERGNIFTARTDFDMAIEDYTQAIRLDPNFALAYGNRGLAYYKKGDYDRAIADYTQAIRLDPDYAAAAAYNNRGLAYADKKDYDRAIADWEAVLRIDPDDAQAKHNIGVARR